MLANYMHSDLACEIEEEGIVLVKNEGVLPFQKSSKVLIIGERSRYPMLGGGGSSEVYTEEYIDLYHGLREFAEQRKVKLINQNDRLIDYQKLLDELADEQTTVVYTIARFSTEGEDLRSLSLSQLDREILSYCQESKVKNIVVILNVPAFFWAGELEEYDKVKGVLFSYYGGMYIGKALAKVLTGTVCPSGRLPNTIARSEKDYPSNDGFFEEEGKSGFAHFDEEVDKNAKRTKVEYKEGIFVGYRYFEENNERKNTVVYPFGFGLSYTDFNVNTTSFSYEADEVKIGIEVVNVGEGSGKETAQVYVQKPSGEPVSPKFELIDFAKTDTLKRGQKQDLTFTVKLSDCTSFDEKENAFVLKKGKYRFFAGKHVRDLTQIGEVEVYEKQIVKSVKTVVDTIPAYPYRALGDVTLADVASGKHPLKEFVCSLTDEDFVGLSQAKEPSLPGGTGCFGKIYERGVPDIQSSDGPAGLRRAGTNATYFPCATACAATWNKDLIERMGEALGEECIALKTDVLLAPGVNLHRHPFCGRNFEYFSEDPYLAGRMAAAYVNGLQSKGIGACVKHFVANNKEDNRKDSDSIVCEQAIRELYVKVFEITLAYSKPWCIMTSYNILNGVRCSANKKTLRLILRGDLGYDGLIMTDWEVASTLKEELIAGSNLKNPCGHPDYLETLADELKAGEISRDVLAESAEYMFKAVMKTNKFKEGRFCEVFPVTDGTTLDATHTSMVTSTRAQSRRYDSGFGHCLTNMVRDGRGNLPTVAYELDVEKEGDYELTALLSGKAASAFVTVLVDGKEQGRLTLGEISLIEGKSQRDCTAERTCNVRLSQGRCTLALFFNEDTEAYYSVEIGTLNFKRIQ